MLHSLLSTPDDLVLTFLRVILGVVFFAHGAQKMLGWFGGPGLQKTLGMFKQYLGIPAPLALLAVVAEFFGGLGLIVGLLSRVAAFGVGFNMLIAALKVHLRHGLFINWSGEQQGHGFEFQLLAIAMAVPIIVHGAGALSLDAILSQMI
jgi:putative oxidoreductase